MTGNRVIELATETNALLLNNPKIAEWILKTYF